MTPTPKPDDETTAAPSMPEAETAHLLAAYAEARVILEYGSGGSTRAAAQMPGKLVFSVESDLNWARAMRRAIAGMPPRSQVVILHVDIGETGPWGRPLDDSAWRNYHRFPNAIWDEPYFRHPDLVLIDGRFRKACLLTVALRAARPVRVLFDDYYSRPKYHVVERALRPVRAIGRMAEFHVAPGSIDNSDLGYVLAQFFDVTVHGSGRKAYALPENDRRMICHDSIPPQEGRQT